MQIIELIKRGRNLALIIDDETASESLTIVMVLLDQWYCFFVENQDDLKLYEQAHDKWNNIAQAN